MGRIGCVILLCMVIMTLNCSDSSIPNKTSPKDSPHVSLSSSGVQSAQVSFSVPVITDVEKHPGKIVVTGEAELLAQWLEDVMYPPVNLTRKLERELSLIRNQWGETIREAEIKFFPVYVPGELIIGFTDDGWQDFKSNDYHHWDVINEMLELDSIDIFMNDPDYYKNVLLKFGDPLNSNLLVYYYTGLPGLSYVHVNSYCCDWLVLLVYREGEDCHYFFRNAWGDCPSGCIYNEYFYFTIDGDTAKYEGSYMYDWGNIQPAPPWMQMVNEAKAKYWVYNFWTLDEQ